MSQKDDVGNIYLHGVGAPVEGLQLGEELCVVVQPSVTSIQNLIWIQLDFVSDKDTRLRCNSSGKLDYKIWDIRSTRQGFYHRCFLECRLGLAVLSWFILIEILTSISIHLLLAALHSNSAELSQTKRTLPEININTKAIQPCLNHPACLSNLSNALHK